MDAKTRTPEEIFGTHIRHVIPPFQRPYVWNEEKQWQPLWEDVRRTAGRVLDAMEEGDRAVAEVPPHFLGAIVLEHTSTRTGHIQTRNVVDGQQRLTTLQLLLDAAQLVVAEHGSVVDSEALQALVLNNPRVTLNPDERFKVWPSRIDRLAFRVAMDDEATVPPELRETPIVLAHDFFRRAILEWAEVDGDPDKVMQRLAGLTIALHRHIALVAIDLTQGDNPQIIFETLNDRGTPLLAADLVKNFIFQSGEQSGADVEAWDREYWKDFDDDWWREEVAQGRYYRSRIDIFLQYWLTMRLQDEVPSEEAFRRFRIFAESVGIDDAKKAVRLLAELRHDADQFRGFADFDPDSAEGIFYYRVVEALQMAAVSPILLWLLAERHGVPEMQRARALAALESWVVRRTLLRLTTKDVTRMVVALLKELEGGAPDDAGRVTERFLTSQTAYSRYWPKDDELIDGVAKAKMYGSLQQGRIRMVLEAVEDHLRTEKSEIQTCPRGLQIEHIMPQAWRDYWGAGALGDPVASARRDIAVQTLGNLTLVNSKLNPALANLPWTDIEVPSVRSGKDAPGKRSQLTEHSVLLLNRELVNSHPDSWTEQDVAARSTHLAQAIAEIWPAMPGGESSE